MFDECGLMCKALEMVESIMNGGIQTLSEMRINSCLIGNEGAEAFANLLANPSGRPLESL